MNTTIKINATYVELALAIAMGLKSARNEQAKLKSSRTGTYDRAVDLAILVKSNGDGWNELEACFAELEHQIRTDGRVAQKVGADKRKDEGKNGEKYNIPSGIMAVKSVLKSAFLYDVDLVDESGDSPVPMAYTAIKKDIKGIKQAEASEKELATMSPAEQADRDFRAKITGEYIQQIINTVNKASGSDLDRIAELVLALSATLEKAAPKTIASSATSNDVNELAATG